MCHGTLEVGMSESSSRISRCGVFQLWDGQDELQLGSASREAWLGLLSQFWSQKDNWKSPGRTDFKHFWWVINISRKRTIFEGLFKIHWTNINWPLRQFAIEFQGWKYFGRRGRRCHLYSRFIIAWLSLSPKVSASLHKYGSCWVAPAFQVLRQVHGRDRDHAGHSVPALAEFTTGQGFWPLSVPFSCSVFVTSSQDLVP